MAKILSDKEQENNPYLQEIEENLSRFLENISCLRDTYEDTERTLLKQKKGAEKQFYDLVKNFPIDSETGDMTIPVKHFREFQKRGRHKIRTERALSLVPQSYLVSLVSLYDQFYAGLVRLIYRIEPEKLKESNKTFCYRDLCEYISIQEVKVEIVDETVEGLLRDSHVKQFEWLASAMGLSTLKEFSEWPVFVELTERRNLFVHSDGIVSQQYIGVCNSENVKLPKEIVKGSQLLVDKDYFEQSFKTLYVVGIKLTQMLAHAVYDKQYPNNHDKIDKLLISNVYELISEELYDVAISVSEFALNNRYFKHEPNDQCYIILNYAQAYKWNGQPEECQELLDNAGCSIWKDELLIPKLALEGKFEQVYSKMRTVGNKSDILTSESYRQWPIFKEIRKEEMFAAVFKDIFGEELEINIPKKVENSFSYIDTDKQREITEHMDSDSKGHFFFYFSNLKEKNDGIDNTDKENK